MWFPFPIFPFFNSQAPVPAGGATSYENVKISKSCKSTTASTVEYVAMGHVLPKSQVNLLSELSIMGDGGGAQP